MSDNRYYVKDGNNSRYIKSSLAAGVAWVATADKISGGGSSASAVMTLCEIIWPRLKKRAH
jgi:hypothetical protein